jgi:DNA-binding transcriptional LysR family regulator
MRKQSSGAAVAEHAIDDVQSMVIFARVIQERSFTRAARALATSTSAVSKRIAGLERRAGARLLARTTRHVAPTEAGLALYERCLRILREVEDAELMVLGLSDVPRGLLRVSAPVYFGELHVAPLLAELLIAEPELRVELSLTDRFVDLVPEGIDLAVRIGKSTGASLITRKLALTRVVACASPAYLQRRGRPLAPKDLLEHDCLRYSLDPIRNSWRFSDSRGQDCVIPVTGAFESNHGGALCRAASSGLGIVLLPLFYVAEAIEAGELVSVLEEYCATEIHISAVYPAGRQVPPKTRACMDWLARALPLRLAQRGLGGEGVARERLAVEPLSARAAARRELPAAGSKQAARTPRSIGRKAARRK